MLKAGALLYAMFLVIVTTIISSSFILSNYYNSTAVLTALKKEQLYMNVNSGISYGLTLQNEIPLSAVVEIDLFNDGKSKVTIEKKDWGAFYIISSKAKWKNRTFRKSAMVGSSLNKNVPALYLTDQDKALSLCGNTKIKGNCYLPKSGIKRGYIEGKSFAGEKLVNGSIKTSGKRLPEINKELLQKNLSHLKTAYTNKDSVIDFESIAGTDSIVNSFKNKPLVVYAANSILLSDKIIKGNVILKCAGTINISSNTSVENGLFYAKKIIVEDRFAGSVQLFASESITIDKNCDFHYPSAIAVLSTSNSSSDQSIFIDEGCNINGMLFLYNMHLKSRKQLVASMEKNTQLQGEVFSSELLELKGNVTGSVLSRGFVLKTPSSTYENHLLDVSINKVDLSSDFVGSALIQEKNKQEIVQWLF